MSNWPSTRAKRVLAVLLRIGWAVKRFAFAFHDNEEIGPRMLARIAKHPGLKPEDL